MKTYPRVGVGRKGLPANAANRKRRALVCGVAVAALGACGPAWAQAQGVTAAQPAEPALTEVIVTAQKRSERLVDVPMSISVISAKTAEDRGIRNLQDLSQSIAGVEIDYGGFATQPSIRGVTSTTPLFENNVVVYIDGIYQPNDFTIDADMANLDNVQILKGPQGTLYGRNATGGAILYTTLDPSKTYQGSLELGYGNFNDLSGSGYVSGPITDRIRFSVAGYGRESDGYYKLLNAQGQKIGNAAPIKSYSAHTKLQADLTNNITATLAYNYTDFLDARGLMFTDYANRPSYMPAQVGDLYQHYTFAAPSSNTDLLNLMNEVSFTLVDKTPIGTLTSHTGYSYFLQKEAFQYDGSYANFAHITGKNRERTLQESVDYDITAIDRTNLTIGGTYYHDVLDNTPSDVFDSALPGPVPAQQTNQINYTEAWALFLQGDYHLTNRLTLSAGMRYSEEERSESYAVLYPDPPNPPIYPNPPVYSKNERANFPNLSPQGSVRYQFSPGSEAYASITEGFRSGQTQVIGTSTGNEFLPVKPEKITSYEVGYKLDRSNIQFTTAAYYYDYTDIQVAVTTANPLNPAAPISLVSNAPKATIYGAEAEIKWSPIQHLSFDASGAWIHARYGTFTNATGVGYDPSTSTDVPGQVQNLTGLRMPRAPAFSGAFAVNYEFEDVVGGRLMATANIKATSDYVINDPSVYGPLASASLQRTQRYIQSAYALVNGSLVWTDPTKHYHIGVYANNIFNKYYWLDYAGTAFGDTGTGAPPKTYGVRIGYKF